MESMSLNRFIIYVIAAVCLIVVIPLIYWYWSSYIANEEQQDMTLTKPNDYLEQNNSYYRQAVASARSQDWLSAKRNYEQSLTLAESHEEEAQIKFRLATTEERLDPVAAIPLYKEIIANENYPDAHRAYAAERLASMYYINNRHLLSREEFEAIRNETFKDEPYRSMAEGADTALAYRRLFEYASSFHPLAISQSFIALWYADAILAVRQGETEPPEGYDEQTYLDKITQAISNTETDISRTKNDRNSNNLILHATYRLARSTVKLALAGLADPEDVQLAYLRVLNVHDGLKILYPEIVGWDGFIRVDYLKYLLQVYPDGEKGDTVAMLMQPLHLYWNQTYSRHADFSDFIANEHEDRHGAKWALVTYANTDPDFKVLLIDLGWEESDFDTEEQVTNSQ